MSELGRSVRALVVDDEADMRALVRAAIRIANRGLSVLAEAGSGEEAISLFREHQPDVIVLDQRMPGMTGLEVAVQILAEKPDQSIILFTAFLTEALEREADDIGICECVSKSHVEQLPEALWRCAAAI